MLEPRVWDRAGLSLAEAGHMVEAEGVANGLGVSFTDELSGNVCDKHGKPLVRRVYRKKEIVMTSVFCVTCDFEIENIKQDQIRKRLEFVRDSNRKRETKPVPRHFNKRKDLDD